VVHGAFRRSRGLAPKRSSLSLEGVCINHGVIVLLRGMRFCVNLRLLIKDLPVFAVLRHIFEVGNMVFDLGLCVHNVVRLLDFDWIFDALIIHPRFVLVLGHHYVLIVGLVSRARSHSVVFLM
jgi:hypothetical protein